MRRLRSGVLALLLALGVATAAPDYSLAIHGESKRDQAEEMARDAMEQLMKALELFMDSIPQYEAPEFNEDGDIIIRRKRKQRDRHEAPDHSGRDETST